MPSFVAGEGAGRWSRCTSHRSLHTSFSEREVQRLITFSFDGVVMLPDSLRRRLTRWLVWAARPDHSHVIFSAQAPQKRPPDFRRCGRERGVGP